ncbi:MAG TPA: CHAT domain-containing protein [Fimbriimonadaceae bacterium]|nr:CHAT domain-containing protein [Fimbriimonadaceae bacterium]
MIASSEVSADALRSLALQWRAARSAAGSPGRALESLGVELSRTVFGARILAALQRVASERFALAAPLRLGILCESALMRELPWEASSAHAESAADPLDGPLALHPRVRLFRVGRETGVGLPEPPRNLRVLVASADPGTGKYRPLAWVPSEFRAISASLARRADSGIALRSLLDVVPAVLERTLREFRPHIVHFSGHGEARPTGGVLVLQGATPRTETHLHAEEFGSWLASAGVELLVLAACDTAGHSSALGEAIQNAGVPAVLAMQASIQDATLPQFSRTLYGSLMDGAAIDEAVAEARQSQASNIEAWATPVLYLGAEARSFVEAPVTRASRETPNNLPTFGGRLIGREKDMEEVAWRIGKRHSRLVTITGAGGIGKSRFAASLSRRLLSDYPDGAWMIECDSITGIEELYARIAGVTGLTSWSGTALEAVSAYLADKRCLLLLDCFEGLVATGHAKEIEKLLGLAPSITVVTTSRTRLDVPSEDHYALSPLEAPQMGSGGAPSIELFFEAAGLDQRGTTESQRRVVAEICSHLEGLPLAIVLAGGRARLLDLTELQLLLKRNTLRLLDGQLGRLSLAIQRSLSLVSREDRELLRRLGIFVGSFSWADVMAVYPEDPFELLDGLTRLCDSSLLQSVSTPERKRFRVLDTIREHMAAMIQDEKTAIVWLEARERHAAHFCAIADEFAASMEQGKWAEASAALWVNLSNFRAALAFCAEYRRIDKSSRLVAALCRTLMEAGLWQDFEFFASEGYRAADALADRGLASTLLGLEGAMAARRGDEAKCRRLWLERVATCSELGDDAGAADTLIDLAIQHLQVRELDEGSALLDRAEKHIVRANKAELTATARALRARISVWREEPEEAMRLAAEAEREAATATERDPLLFVETQVARVRIACGDLEGGERGLLHVLRVASEGDRRVQAGIALTELGELYEREGRIETAGLCFDAAAKVYDQIGSRRRTESKQRLEEFRQRYEEYAIATAGLRRVTWQERVAEILQRARDTRR